MLSLAVAVVVVVVVVAVGTVDVLVAGHGRDYARADRRAARRVAAKERSPPRVACGIGRRRVGDPDAGLGAGRGQRPRVFTSSQPLACAAMTTVPSQPVP